MNALSSIIWVGLGILLIVLLLDYIWVLAIAVIVAIIIAVYVTKKRAAESLEQETQKPSQPTNNIQRRTTPVRDPLETFVRYGVSAPHIHQGCPMLYRYPNLAVSNVNRYLLRTMVKSQEFEMQPEKSDDGKIHFRWKGAIIAQLSENTQMCADWLDRGDPLRCEFASFTEGKEKVAIFFYGNQEAKLQSCKCEIVKLTSCMSSAKQDAIACLEEGEKLFLEWDDNDKPYIRDICFEPIGSLPSKFKQACDDDLIKGMFFDHTETKESEDFQKEDKLIPFVRVYT